MVYGEESMRAERNLPVCRTGRQASLTGRSWGAILVMAAVMLSTGGSAFADFLVQPITIKKQVYPGRSVKLDFKVENISRDTTERVFLRLGELTQDANGVWTEVDPNNPQGVDLSKLRSCKSWLDCPVADVVVDPYQAVPVPMVANVPGGARGFYFAVLIAGTEPRRVELDGAGALVGLRYVVPVILEVQGVPLPHQVAVTDLDLNFRKATLDRPTAAVIASMSIANSGGTYSRLKGLLRVFQESGGNWKRIADLTLPECGIIPSVSLSLKKDLGMLLPSGKYRMEGYLYVDGRRGSAVQKEFDFEGDNRVVDPRTIAPIAVDKDNLLIDIVPGGNRGGSVMLTNESEDPVTVAVELTLPPHMRGANSGRNVRGDNLDCSQWVTVMPEELTLPRYGRRGVNLLVKMPATATDYSNYYGTLRLHATHDDGSPAGMRTVNVCLTNPKAERTNYLDPLEFYLSQAGPGRYIATSFFNNNGVTHVWPKCRGVLTGTGDNKYKQFLMESAGQPGIQLPLEKRQFSGVLDLSDIPEGVYRLTAVLEYSNSPNTPASESAQNQILVEVYEQDGQKSARIAEWTQAPDGKVGRTIIKL